MVDVIIIIITCVHAAPVKRKFLFYWDKHINLYCSHTYTLTFPIIILSLSLSPSLHTHTHTHTHTQRSDDLEQFQRELEALKNRLRGEHENLQRDHDASQAAKDAIIEQLRRELHDTQARLNEAENKIVELTTSKAAEIVSQSTCTRITLCVQTATCF